MSIEQKALETTVSGTAKNAKAGAVLLTGDERVIYIQGLVEWPEDVLDAVVTARGYLREEKMIPSPEVADDGAISTGASGKQLVLSDVRWTLGPD